MEKTKENTNPWVTLNTQEIYDCLWIAVSRHDVINPGNKKGVYSTVHFKNLAIGVIPLDEEYNTWIVGQYRYPIKEYTWEIPEGGGDLKVPSLASAKRELLEETGIKAKEWTKIMEMHLSNSATDEHAIIYVAKGLSFHPPQPEEDEDIVIQKIPFNKLLEKVMNGKIKDSLTVAGILKVELLRQQGLI